MKVARYARAANVVWRAGPDRVLLRQVGGHSDCEAVELFGPAALVWLALDEPATSADLTERLMEADIAADLSEGLRLLVDRHVIVEFDNA